MQGLLLINKPEGKTSFQAVSAVKRAACEKRVGHTGTLDPMATGVLPILLGRATALSSIMLDADKRYTARIKLGVTTDTDDITGNIISERSVDVSESELEAALLSFCGKQSQIPPLYSALKKDGVRLYRLAREGKTAEIEPREIEVFEIKRLSEIDGENSFSVDVHVSKGTYIRALARDIGERLGCGATLSALKRTYAGGFNIEDCIDLEKLNSENIKEHLKSEELAVRHLREAEVTERQAVRFCNGGQLDFERVKISNPADGELLRIKYADRLMGIGIADCASRQVGIKCVINYPEGV